MINPIIDNIIELFQKEYELLKEVQMLNNKKTNFIIENNINGLNELSSHEKQKIDEINNMEAQRQELLKEVSILVGKQVSSIDDLLMLCNDFQRQRLSESKAKMIRVINDLKNINQLNLGLIKNSLEYVDFMVNMISSFLVDDSTYQKDGQSKSNKKNLFDIKL